MHRGSRHGSKAPSPEQHDTLLEKEATVEQPIASNRLYEELILG
jgi:hypothetical protein